MITDKGFYLLINSKKSEIVTLSDDYELLIQFMINHEYICRNCVVRQVKRKEFEECLQSYEDYYLCDVEGIAIRQKDVGTFLRLRDEENCSMINTMLGLKRLVEWGSLKKKEKEALINAMKILIKYMDDDEKMLKKSGIKSMCSDIEYLEGLQELQYRK